jgi:hypothetical protein
MQHLQTYMDILTKAQDNVFDNQLVNVSLINLYNVFLCPNRIMDESKEISLWELLLVLLNMDG